MSELCQKFPISRLEPVSSLVNGENVSGMGRFFLQLPPKFGYVGVHGPAHYSRSVSPNLLKKLHPVRDSPFPSNECQKEVEFLRCEGYIDTVSIHGPGSSVDGNIPKNDRGIHIIIRKAEREAILDLPDLETDDAN